MTQAELRLLIVSKPALVRDLMLTDYNIKVLKYVKEMHTCCTSDVVRKFGICTVSASMLLKRLYNKGYVSRFQQPDPTGGLYYEYRWNLLGNGYVEPL